MGKDQELLEAARTGNLHAVKTILAGKLPRSGSGSGGLSGGLRSLLALKPVNVNCTDASGETPLHLAALNGHKDVVEALLPSKVSLTDVDSKGCTPLHLAAWNGHTDICHLLLQEARDKHIHIVNVQTNEGETPLHFASQHGHQDVVSLLLQSKADPTVRTLTERSALDLAAQYGKTTVVRLLVTGRPELLLHQAGQPSPLHLAAFNGHLPIVSFLLDSGFPVNTRTDNGTALHEAATSCKLDVIKLLLDRGVDVWAKARNEMTAEDILKSIHSKLTHEALQIISNHVNSQRTPDSDGERDINGIPGPGSVLTGEVSPPGAGRPVPKPRSIYGDSQDMVQYRKTDSTSTMEPHSPPPPVPPRISLRPVDTAPFPDSGTSHLTPEGSSKSRDASPMSSSREQPKKPPRKTPSMRKTETSQSTTSDTSTDTTTSFSIDSTSLGGESLHSTPVPLPCDMDSSHMDYVNIDIDKSGRPIFHDRETGGGQEDSVLEGSVDRLSVVPEAVIDNLCEVENIAKRESIYANATMIAAEEAKISKPRLLELETSKKRDSTEAASSVEGADQPTSPTHYPQPPTPDCPPPSPSTALHGIHQKLNPQDKRRSRDMNTITESTLLQAATSASSDAPAAAPQPSVSEPVTPQPVTPQPVASSAETVVVDCSNSPKPPVKAPKPVVAEKPKPAVAPKPANKAKLLASSCRSTVEDGDHAADSIMTTSDINLGQTLEVEGERVEMRRSVSSGDTPIDWESNVFAGLLRGSTPGGPRSVVSQICENVGKPLQRVSRRLTTSALVTFDPLMEREEDREVIDAERVLGEIEAMTGPSGATTAEGPRVSGQTTGRGDFTPGKRSEDSFDDSEEWAKIAATLGTFGVGIARESVFVRDFEASFAKSLAAGRNMKIQSVGEWLENIGLGQYENTLVANGFDDTDFLGGNIMEEQDLATIGITNESHRAAIVNAAQKLPPLLPIDQVVLPESVERWLESLRLGQYLDTFVSHKYNTMQRVVKLWELELNTVLDITSLGHRKRILASLGDRTRDRDASHSPCLSTRRRQSEDEAPPRSPFENVDLYRDYTGVRPQGTSNGSAEPQSPLRSPLLSFEQQGENGPVSNQSIRDSQIHIRPPHLMHTSGSIKQWRHRPEILIKGCCNYTAHYLGSTIVKELKGATTTQEGIAKLKKSTEVISKIPTIMLSISYKGVKFIDAKSKKVICDHEIANIFCACQDGDHMNFFAYVTKDKETSRHYCHVFSVRSRELAGEIILTLGEAFEIAYQMALKEKAEEDAELFERQLSQSDQDDTTSLSSNVSTV